MASRGRTSLTSISHFARKEVPARRMPYGVLREAQVPGRNARVPGALFFIWHPPAIRPGPYGTLNPSGPYLPRRGLYEVVWASLAVLGFPGCPGFPGLPWAPRCRSVLTGVCSNPRAGMPCFRPKVVQKACSFVTFRHFCHLQTGSQRPVPT